MIQYYQYAQPTKRKTIPQKEKQDSFFGLSRSKHSAADPGLILLQIDGLSKFELNKALQNNQMPFLNRLLKRENYRLFSHYPGVPSTTPAVQGELFYGVKQAVPSFFFFDRETQKMFRMFDGDSVREIEARLAAQGKGLLEGGSSYSNIFRGGAQESHFCASSLGWDRIWKDVNPVNFMLIILTHFPAFLRMVFLVVWETMLALMDFVYGLIKKEDMLVELKFVPMRVMICILLRELITLGAVIDIARGLPVIHLNFLGYDEQAHRRGPGSQTAHWALKGIDKAISRIYRAAIHSHRRHYDVWVYSDHGQEPTVPYISSRGITVEEKVGQIYNSLFKNKGKGAAAPRRVKDRGVVFQRARYLGLWVEKAWPLNSNISASVNEDVAVAAMGPLGGVYLFKELSLEDKYIFAKELVRSAKIPLVLLPEDNGKVRAWNQEGEFVLPEQGKEILGSDHPFYADVLNDLMVLCRHPNAGTFVISGWSKNEKPLSFPFENGAHAGPGPHETDAFVLMPSGIVSIPADWGYLRTGDIREAALKLLRRYDPETFINGNPLRSINEVKRTVRLMTYNVHSCIGMDGKISPQRIARIIKQYEPDIVALQELDMGRQRTQGIDQPHLIAHELEMLYHFHPSIQVEEEQYGNAVLSRYPMELVCAMQLPRMETKINLEPRGAIWVAVALGRARLQIVNTHLSLFAPECSYQARALMSQDWIGHANCAAPAVLCGDFNSLPYSRAWRTISRHLGDAQRLMEEHRPLATWFGRYPIGRIDHVFVSPGIKIKSIEVPRTQLTQLASDHLPLIVDLEVVYE